MGKVYFVTCGKTDNWLMIRKVWICAFSKTFFNSRFVVMSKEYFKIKITAIFGWRAISQNSLGLITGSVSQTSLSHNALMFGWGVCVWGGGISGIHLVCRKGQSIQVFYLHKNILLYLASRSLTNVCFQIRNFTTILCN